MFTWGPDILGQWQIRRVVYISRIATKNIRLVLTTFMKPYFEYSQVYWAVSDVLVESRNVEDGGVDNGWDNQVPGFVVGSGKIQLYFRY